MKRLLTSRPSGNPPNFRLVQKQPGLSHSDWHHSYPNPTVTGIAHRFANLIISFLRAGARRFFGGVGIPMRQEQITVANKLQSVSNFVR